MRPSIVLLVLLVLLGCRGSEEASSFRDIPKLTTERLSAIPDNEVEFAIVEYVGTVIGDDWS